MKVPEVITNRILDRMREGVIPWQQGYKDSQNFISGHIYTGVNRLILMACSNSSYFMTFKQALSLEGCVKQGSHGFPVIYMGKTSITATKKRTGEEYEKMVSFLRYYTVFSVEDIDIPEEKRKPLNLLKPTPEQIQTIEDVLKNYQDAPKVKSEQLSAHYHPGSDTINLPAVSSYSSMSRYFQSFFHELVHSTGAKNRLNRDGVVNPIVKGDSKYCREELVAEIGMAFLCERFGVENYIDDVAGYLKYWIDMLRGDANLIIIAASQAEKAVNWILNKKNKDEIFNGNSSS